MIQIEHLTKQFGKETVIKDVTVTFHSGMIYGLVGTNGCGKTTLMRCICGFVKPTSGKILVTKKQVGKDVDFAPNTGIIIETPGFLPHYSGLRNLLILANISHRANKNRAVEVMQMVGLDASARKPVGNYSLGMRQRLGIAQAIMENPDLLILDEPFNGMDREGIREIHALFQDLKKQGKTILLASHSAADIAQACDIVYELQNGQLVERPALSAAQVG